jgi:hypothetical protein
MEDLLADLTRGNPLAVKTVLASVMFALAIYQVVLAAVGYGKLRARFLDSGPAFLTHRSSGDVIAVLLLVVGAICLASGEDEDDATFHAITGALLLAVLTLKVIVVRWWHGAGRFLPLLGSAVFLLLGLTWVGSAGEYLA